MRIENSTVAMSSWRLYEAEVEEKQESTRRAYSGDRLVSENTFSKDVAVSYYEVEGGAGIYTTSAAGVEKKNDGQFCRKQEEEKDVGKKNKNREPADFRVIEGPERGWNWVSNMKCDNGETAEIQLVRRMLEALNQFRERHGGKKLELPMDRLRTTADAIQFKASAASVKYQQSMAMFGAAGAANVIDVGQHGGSGNSGGSGAVTQWTMQTVQSGFIAGQENMAFCSTGSVQTSDGRSIEFNISMEMSRSFAAAYHITGVEEAHVYTDPLVINMDTDNATLDDVKFYFDLNNDGTAEEISNLDEFSGLLALDKNGDGEINNGGELFGAMTGDGFGELAAYDEDGNGWIDENDAVFSELRVWMKCGTEDAQLLSLSEADVGAIFLGSQVTNYTLADSQGEEGAMVRQTGIYLKESGGAGTVQHVDFKA